MHKHFSTLVVTMSLSLFIGVFPAAARIECRENFQVTKSGLISTPYCEEKQIARVARSYGMAVTGSQQPEHEGLSRPDHRQRQPP